MKKGSVSEKIDFFIVMIEEELSKFNKHAIKTETLKNRVLPHITIDSEDDETKYLADVGFAQLIQQRLYAAGYRSVRTGVFVNLDRCTDLDYLREMLNNADINVQDKEKIWLHIKKQFDAQIGMRFNGSEIDGVVIPMSEDEFLDKLNSDAI